LIDLIIRQGIEAGSRHNHSVGDVFGDISHTPRKDANLNRNCFGGFRMVTREHVDRNASLVTSLYGRS
jgi:hypothetical protein